MTWQVSCIWPYARVEFVTATSASRLEDFMCDDITGPDNETPPEFLSAIDRRNLRGPLMRVKLTRLRGGGCVLGAGPYVRCIFSAI